MSAVRTGTSADVPGASSGASSIVPGASSVVLSGASSEGQPASFEDSVVQQYKHVRPEGDQCLSSSSIIVSIQILFA